MTKREVQCPSCGGAVPFKSSVSLIAVCPYCKSQVVRGDLKVEALGKVALLQEDGSVIQLATTGTFKGDSFQVVGRVQLRFPQGFWNEWFLDFNGGRQGWLGEAQGLYAVSFKTDPKSPVPPFSSLSVGKKVTVDGEEFEIRDLRRAEYLSAEGELPFRPPLGQTIPLADCVTSGGRFATFDYSEAEPILFLGEFAEFDSLGLQLLKEVEGW